MSEDALVVAVWLMASAGLFFHGRDFLKNFRCSRWKWLGAGLMFMLSATLFAAAISQASLMARGMICEQI